MPSAKLFRDRVVSLEQTYEQGEKYLTLLRTLIEEAIPGLTFREYLLDHERDTFVMVYAGAGEAEKRISWTRMVLYDAERIPAVAQDPSAAIRARILGFLRANAGRPTIAVTFRHLEDGWIDTPEPKKQKPPRERGRIEQASPQVAPREQQRKQQRPPVPTPAPAGRVAPPAPAADATSGDRAGAPGAGRRRFRRRRRRGGRGKGGSSPPPGGAGTPS